MLRRLIKALASIAATAVVIIAVLIVLSTLGQRHQSDPDVYAMRDDRGYSITCHRDNSGFTIRTSDEGEILEIRPVSDRAEMQRCIKAFQSGTLPFDPRNFVGRYEAGYLSWEGVNHENVYYWDIPDECEPHYQFKEKSHPWLVDALGLVDTIEVTFEWAGTNGEWDTCSIARERQLTEIDLSELEIPTIGRTLN